MTLFRAAPIDLVLMDTMTLEMDGYIGDARDPQASAVNGASSRSSPSHTAKAMRDDQEKCLAAGANDYIAKPLDVEKLLSLVRVWMPR